MKDGMREDSAYLRRLPEIHFKGGDEARCFGEKGGKRFFGGPFRQERSHNRHRDIAAGADAERRAGVVMVTASIRVCALFPSGDVAMQQVVGAGHANQRQDIQAQQGGEESHSGAQR